MRRRPRGDVLEREWVSVRDPANARLRYTFDVSYLLSNYQCIYGQGCKGTRTDELDPVVGCCLHGAYYVDKAEQRRAERLVRTLGRELMQHYDEARAGGVTEVDDEGEAHTRVVNGGCIFLNRAGFPTGPGCAFHHLALARGEHHMTHKPTVCWQLPLHRDIVEQTGNDGETFEVHTIGPYERGTWGTGGAEFLWWCTEAPEAFTAKRPVYESMETELRTMVGDAVYEELAAYLKVRRRKKGGLAFLPMAN